MEYNTSATPSSPEDNPIQDKVSVETVSVETVSDETVSDEKTSVEKGSAEESSAEKASGKAVSAPARPMGPNASAIVMGLVAMLLAGLIIAKETMDWRIDWSRLGPGAIVGIGVVMVVIGAIGLIRRHDDT